MSVRSSFKKYNNYTMMIATFMVAIIFVLGYVVYAAPNYTANFLKFKLEKVRLDVPYEILVNEDKTKTYVVYNYNGDIYDEEEVIKSPYEIVKLKEATSSIMRENNILSYDYVVDDVDIKGGDVIDLDSSDMKRYMQTQIVKNIATYSYINDKRLDENTTYDMDNSDITVLKVGKLCADKYYPVVFRKKSILKIPKEIIKNIKKMDILIVFNVARNDIKPSDMWKFRYIEDVMVNAGGSHNIDTIDDKRTTCLQIKYQYKHEDVLLMKFEYHQANDRSGYAYVDVDHVLDREELMDRVVEYDIEDVDRYIDDLDYKFISDEWQVSYDDGDIDFYLRKWVTYKVNVYKDVWEKARLDVGDVIYNLRFDDIGYVIEVR